MSNEFEEFLDMIFGPDHKVEPVAMGCFPLGRDDLAPADPNVVDPITPKTPVDPNDPCQPQNASAEPESESDRLWRAVCETSRGNG